MRTRESRSGVPIPRGGRARLVSPLALLTLFLLPVGEGQAADLFAPAPDTEAQAALPPDDDLTLRRRVVTLDLEQVERAQAAVEEAAQPVPPPRAAPDRPRRPRPARSEAGQPLPPPSAAATATRASTAFTPGTLLTFNLFDDVVVTGRVERTAPTFSGGYSISGHLVEDPLGTITLVVNGETVAGTVRRLGETYHIRSVGEGLYAISEVEEPQFSCGVDDLHADHTGHQH